MAGHALYPPPQSLMVNNYPPLVLLSGGGADPCTAMTMSSLPDAGCRCWLSWRDRRVHRAGAAPDGLPLDARPSSAPCSSPAVLLITSDYVGMDDPQLLGHALQMAALLLLLRETRSCSGALLFAASLFHQAQSAGPAAGGAACG